MYIYDIISSNYPQNKNIFLEKKNGRENQNTCIVPKNYFPKIVQFMGKRGKILYRQTRPQMTIQYGARTLHAG